MAQCRFNHTTTTHSNTWRRVPGHSHARHCLAHAYGMSAGQVPSSTDLILSAGSESNWSNVIATGTAVLAALAVDPPPLVVVALTAPVGAAGAFAPLPLLLSEAASCVAPEADDSLTEVVVVVGRVVVVVAV